MNRHERDDEPLLSEDLRQFVYFLLACAVFFALTAVSQ